MDIEWDADKAVANFKKHGVRLLTVVYTLRDEKRIRLISARKATRKEGVYYA